MNNNFEWFLSCIFLLFYLFVGAQEQSCFNHTLLGNDTSYLDAKILAKNNIHSLSVLLTVEAANDTLPTINIAKYNKRRNHLLAFLVFDQQGRQVYANLAPHYYSPSLPKKAKQLDLLRQHQAKKYKNMAGLYSYYNEKGLLDKKIHHPVYGTKQFYYGYYEDGKLQQKISFHRRFRKSTKSYVPVYDTVNYYYDGLGRLSYTTKEKFPFRTDYIYEQMDSQTMRININPKATTLVKTREYYRNDKVGQLLLKCTIKVDPMQPDSTNLDLWAYRYDSNDRIIWMGTYSQTSGNSEPIFEPDYYDLEQDFVYDKQGLLVQILRKTSDCLITFDYIYNPQIFGAR